MDAVPQTKDAEEAQARAEPVPASRTSVKPAAAKKAPKPKRPEAPASRALMVMGLAAFVMVIAAEAVARGVTAPPAGRAPSVQRLPDEPLSAPKPPASPQVLVMGSSQLYMEPGVQRGDALRTDANLTTVDYLARATGLEASTYVYGYPRLLPFEMIITTKHLLDAGYVPAAAILSITWPTVAHDRELRPPFKDVLREPNFPANLRAELVAAGARPETLAVMEEEIARAAEAARRDALSSHANGVDRWMLRTARNHTALFGRSGELRERVAKSLVDPVVIRLARSPPLASDPVDDANLAINVAVTRDLVAMLRRRGTRVFVYRAPEREETVPITVDDRRDEVLGKLATELALLDVVVVDARTVVPAKYWGFTSQYLDRSHFVSEGHRILAEFVVGEAKSRGFFDGFPWGVK